MHTIYGIIHRQSPARDPAFPSHSSYGAGTGYRIDLCMVLLCIDISFLFPFIIYLFYNLYRVLCDLIFVLPLMCVWVVVCFQCENCGVSGPSFMLFVVVVHCCGHLLWQWFVVASLWSRLVVAVACCGRGLLWLRFVVAAVCGSWESFILNEQRVRTTPPPSLNPHTLTLSSTFPDPCHPPSLLTLAVFANPRHPHRLSLARRLTDPLTRRLSDSPTCRLSPTRQPRRLSPLSPTLANSCQLLPTSRQLANLSPTRQPRQPCRLSPSPPSPPSLPFSPALAKSRQLSPTRQFSLSSPPLLPALAVSPLCQLAPTRAVLTVLATSRCPPHRLSRQLLLSCRPADSRRPH